jgi:hypothetical protein
VDRSSFRLNHILCSVPADVRRKVRRLAWWWTRVREVSSRAAAPPGTHHFLVVDVREPLARVLNDLRGLHQITAAAR